MNKILKIIIRDNPVFRYVVADYPFYLGFLFRSVTADKMDILASHYFFGTNAHIDMGKSKNSFSPGYLMHLTLKDIYLAKLKSHDPYTVGNRDSLIISDMDGELHLGIYDPRMIGKLDSLTISDMDVKTTPGVYLGTEQFKTSPRFELEKAVQLKSLDTFVANIRDMLGVKVSGKTYYKTIVDIQRGFLIKLKVYDPYTLANLDALIIIDMDRKIIPMFGAVAVPFKVNPKFSLEAKVRCNTLYYSNMNFRTQMRVSISEKDGYELSIYVRRGLLIRLKAYDPYTLEELDSLSLIDFIDLDRRTIPLFGAVTESFEMNPKFSLVSKAQCDNLYDSSVNFRVEMRPSIEETEGYKINMSIHGIYVTKLQTCDSYNITDCDALTVSNMDQKTVF